MSASMPCRLCDEPTAKLFEHRVLGRITVGYHQCGTCGLTQTDEPTWLDEAYAGGHALHPADTGVMARNLAARRIVATFLHLNGVRDEPCLDYASGYGIFVRLMRDAGFEFFGWDPMAENLLARGFEWRESHGRPRAVTAFEVLEHWVRPLDEFRALANRQADWIVTSTELHPGPAPLPDWLYLSPETGQHVSFYRAETLQRLGEACGYPHVISGPFVQVFARRPFSGWTWTVASRLSALVFPWVRRMRRSLTIEDSVRMRGAGS